MASGKNELKNESKYEARFGYRMGKRQKKGRWGVNSPLTLGNRSREAGPMWKDMESGGVACQARRASLEADLKLTKCLKPDHEERC